jgi:hypothetical protein
LNCRSISSNLFIILYSIKEVRIMALRLAFAA